MKKITVKKLTVTGALLLVTALLASLFSGAAYTENRGQPGSGCSACALACTACAACSACTCLSCLGGLDMEVLSDYDFDFDLGGDDFGGDYDYDGDEFSGNYDYDYDEGGYDIGDTIELD